MGRAEGGEEKRKELAAGQSVSGTPYEVVGLLGQGGMGRVYEVVHRVLGRRFVLKVLHGQLAQRADLVQRMANEWRTLGALNHKNIVAVTDAGYTSDRIPYYVMERLEGETLADLLRREGPLPVRRAAHYVAGVLDGLAAAHVLGAIHRDIKPQNIFVSAGEAKVLDFGIAKLSEGSRVVTAAGLTVGTPRYMSPEQAAGHPVDARSDIYATGLVFYELLTGRSPFSHVKEPHELVLAHISEEPARVDWVTRSLPEQVGDLLHRWLAKAPAARPPTAAAALKELTALVSGLPMDATQTQDITSGGVYDDDTLGPVAAKAKSEALEPGAEGPGDRTLFFGESDRKSERERSELAATLAVPETKKAPAERRAPRHRLESQAKTPAPVASVVRAASKRMAPWSIVMVSIGLAVAGGASAWLLGISRPSLTEAQSEAFSEPQTPRVEPVASAESAPEPAPAPAPTESVENSDAAVPTERGPVEIPVASTIARPGPAVAPLSNGEGRSLKPAGPASRQPLTTDGTALPPTPPPSAVPKVQLADPLAVDPYSSKKDSSTKTTASKSKASAAAPSVPEKKPTSGALPSSGL